MRPGWPRGPSLPARGFLPPWRSPLPETHEGRKELAERAKEAEESRNTFLAKYHAYEIASAAFQIGIVLASAAVITEIIALAWLSGLLGAGGLAVMALGLFAPHVLHSL